MDSIVCVRDIFFEVVIVLKLSIDVLGVSGVFSFKGECIWFIGFFTYIKFGDA